MKATIYCVQLDSVWEDKEANFCKVRRLLEERDLKGALVVLPEMFATGFSSHLAMTLEPPGGPTEAFLREMAQAHECFVLGGVVTPGQEGRGRNEAVAIGPQGELLARYAKMRPFSFGGESEVHERGDGPQLFEWADLNIAPLICYDLRFPEIGREAVRAGAEVLLYIAAWPIKRQQHWITLLQARAIENQAYVVGVNRCGTDPHFTYSGRSLVVDPHGIIIADAGEQEGVLRAEIDPAIVRDWRAQFPALADAGLAGEEF
jgi:predicted amidohydrolase